MACRKTNPLQFNMSTDNKQIRQKQIFICLRNNITEDIHIKTNIISRIAQAKGPFKIRAAY